MTIINAKDLDQRMGRTIDPNSVPKHDGSGSGHMEANVAAGSESLSVEQGAGRRGAAIFDEREVGQEHAGSTTIIRLNEAQPLEAKQDPRLQQVAAKLPPAAPVAKAPIPVPASILAPRPRTAAELLAQMGLGKKP